MKKNQTENSGRQDRGVSASALKNGETLDDLLPEAYSIVREATYRVTGQASVQILGGIVLHRIAEMKTLRARP